MSQQQYWQKLRDPRWQKKRLEVFQRDDFKCLFCEPSDRTLEVHHHYYVSGREPWDYPLSAFETVCSKCHKDLKESGEIGQLEPWEILKDYVELARRAHRGWGTFDFALEEAALDTGISPEDILFAITFAISRKLISKQQIEAWQDECKTLEKEFSLMEGRVRP